MMPSRGGASRRRRASERKRAAASRTSAEVATIGSITRRFGLSAPTRTSARTCGSCSSRWASHSLIPRRPSAGFASASSRR
jgi:hypothetical protein